MHRFTRETTDLMAYLLVAAICLFMIWLWRRSKQCGVWYEDFGTHCDAARCRRPFGHAGDHHFKPTQADRTQRAPYRRLSR